MVTKLTAAETKLREGVRKHCKALGSVSLIHTAMGVDTENATHRFYVEFLAEL